MAEQGRSRTTTRPPTANNRRKDEPRKASGRARWQAPAWCYVVVVAGSSGSWDHLADQARRDWYYLIAIIGGFAVRGLRVRTHLPTDHALRLHLLRDLTSTPPVVQPASGCGWRHEPRWAVTSQAAPPRVRPSARS
jgi:hypothetical protein